MWSTGLDEHKREQQAGKGGGTEYVSYTYTSSFAVMPCEGPISRPLKIWFGTELVYDFNNGDVKGIRFNYDAANDCYFADEGTKGFKRCWLYRGTKAQMPNPLIEEDKGVGSTPAYRGRVLFVVEDLELEEYGNSIPPVTFLLENCTKNAKDIADNISQRAGLYPWRHCDYRELSSDINEGFVLSEQIAAREYLAMMGIRHGCEWPERDGRIVAIKFGKEPCLTIPEKDLKVKEEGGDTPNTEWTRQQETDLPVELRVGYLDKLRNHTPNTQQATREVTTSDLKEMLNLPMTMDGATARQIASRELYRRWLERDGPEIQLAWKYLWLAASDVITIPTPAGPRDVRLQGSQLPYFGPLVHKAVLASDRIAFAPVYDNTTPPDYSDVYEEGEAINYVIETHSLADSYNGYPHLYVVSSAISGTDWKPTVVSPSAFPGQISQLLTPAFVGTTVNRLSNHNDADYWDEFNTLTIDMIRGSLESVSLEEVLNTANALAVKSGNYWEIIQFQNATYLGEFSGKKRYRISKLLRGRRGTEVHMADHAVGDDVVLLNASVGVLELPISSIGMNLNISFATNSQQESIPHVFHGEPLKPYAGCDLKGTRSGSNLTVTWKRRSRYFGAVLNDPIVGESSELYEAYILNGSTVVRTITGITSPSFTYSSSQQVADFGSVQTSVKVRVYQISQIVGRGYPLEGVL